MKILETAVNRCCPPGDEEAVAAWRGLVPEKENDMLKNSDRRNVAAVLTIAAAAFALPAEALAGHAATNTMKTTVQPSKRRPRTTLSLRPASPARLTTTSTSVTRISRTNWLHGALPISRQGASPMCLKRTLTYSLTCVQRPSCARADSEKISQAAINIAAITGPMTNPLSPKVASPPSVEISTT